MPSPSGTISHSAWVQQLESQTRSELPFDTEYASRLTVRVNRALGTAWTNRGSVSPFDSPYSQSEVEVVLSRWHPTSATTADLLPRILFTSRIQPWHQLLIYLMYVTGPALLAARPRVWCGACAVPLHKSGPSDSSESFRLIMIKCAFGLLQEGLVFQRLKSPIRSCISGGQSGYIRDVGDAHLLLHEVTSIFHATLRNLWCVMGDFKKAFPRTWRTHLLSQLMDTARIRDGMLSLVSKILQRDHIHININGCSTTEVHDGLPEGGAMGPLLFPLHVESLTRALLDAGLGVGINPSIPMIWQGYTWRGHGTPDENYIALILKGLQGQAPAYAGRPKLRCHSRGVSSGRTRPQRSQTASGDMACRRSGFLSFLSGRVSTIYGRASSLVSQTQGDSIHLSTQNGMHVIAFSGCSAVPGSSSELSGSRPCPAIPLSAAKVARAALVM